MNRKLVNGLLLVTLASGGCGMFTSCKDTDDDFQNKVVIGQVNLEKQLADLKEDLKNYVTKPELEGVKTALETAINNLDTAVGNLQSALGSLQTAVDNKADKSVVEALQTKVDGLENTVNTLIATVNNLTDRLDGIDTRLNGIDATIGGITSRIDAIDATLENYAEVVADVLAMKNVLYGEGEEPGLIKQVEDLINEVALNTEDIQNLYELIDTHKIEFEQLQGQLAYYFSSLNERLNNLVTDIILNQTWNPMFGTINLPVGLSSTIAANYYGNSKHALVFPLSTEHSSYEVLHENSGLNTIGATAIGNLLGSLKGDKVTLTANTPFMNEGENNLGQLYLSINPTSINKDNIQFSLVSSDDETAPIDVNVVDTDEKLTFGANITRSAENGFYRANLHVAPENASKISVRVEEGLKGAMKDALVNHTKSDFVSLAKVLMDQMKDILPAYAVKATWESPNTNFLPAEGDQQEPVTNTYIGKYEIAATAIRPLGYEFMQGQGANRDLLPTVGSIKEAFDKAFDEIANKININIKFENIKGLNLSGLGITISIDHISFKDDAPEIVINLGGIEVKGDKTIINDDGTITIKPDQIIGTVPEGEKIVLTYNPNVTPGAAGVEIGEGALNEFMDLMTTKINGMLDQIQGQINNDLITKVDDLIQNQIQGQVNTMLADINNQLKGINGQIETQVNKILADIKSSLLGKLGRVDNLVSKYNNLANRINNMLKDPNHYLQVMMAYKSANGGLGELSSNINFPTHFKSNGGNAVELYATSYTAELIAPSYKKYVAVSRAWNNTTGVEIAYDAQGGAKKANETEFLNEVRPGNQQIFVINTANIEKGVKYEVIYSSLDYQGYTSTRTFYFVVD